VLPHGDSDTGLGFGFEKSLDTFSISVDYITYFDDLGVDISAFNVGFVGYFLSLIHCNMQEKRVQVQGVH